MTDIIQLLPDSVANQIAAGEVVQRPASVVKELVENAIDAGATEITISIGDAGRTSIQIMDNGVGMSDTDARMSFERHATSKIRSAADIFKIRSMGFRGEALASIAAVAHVEMKTKREDDPVGTKIVVKGSVVETQEPVQFQRGTSIQVKNLFYNIPARRKFLKKNETELKYIITEIYHTALAHCDISFTVYKDGDLYAKFPKSNVKQRIVNVFGKRFEKSLLRVESETSICKVFGFIGTPENAKKQNFNQYFFVNNRFFKHRSFQRTVVKAYGSLISPQEYPPFFIFIEVDPEKIDVNIHPTKTEIKFVEEYNISSIIESAVKYSLGKSNIVPSLDFSDDTNYDDMFVKPSSHEVKVPSIKVNPGYNPFANSSFEKEDPNFRNWEQLFEDFERSPEPDIPQQTYESAINSQSETSHIQQTSCLQVAKKYIVTQGKTGLLIIDIKRAHSRIVLEKLLSSAQQESAPCQKILMPVKIELDSSDFDTISDILPELQSFGFDIEIFGKNCFVVNGCPANVDISETEQVLAEFVRMYTENQINAKEKIRENIAVSLAKSTSLFRNVTMQQDEMQAFIAQLFQCQSHSLSADGKVAVILLEYDEILQKFK
ncbi:MAG: DNA mismatch repair endonuclease MutL [Bacteroidales bacterium]|jgi:DNA mismatch repair protein MutL|nr:DNA mismatch repair endonuclease MutL [Bacteroidales bacterium]